MTEPQPGDEEPIDPTDAPAEDKAAQLALDIRFLEREHRLLEIIGNFRVHKDGPKRSAVKRSIGSWLISFFLSGGFIAGVAGFTLTLSTLHEMRTQTREMSMQTAAVIEQNKHFSRQIEIEAEQDYQTRKAQLIATIYDTRRQWPWSKPTPRATDRARAEAVASILRLEMSQAATGAGAERVDLSWANASGVKIPGADLRGARFTMAKLPFAELDRADLRDAKLQGADLTWASLIDAQLDGARIMSATLAQADLMNATLKDANLTAANFTDATLIDADFSGARLSSANLRYTNLQRADLSAALLNNARLEGASLVGVNMSYSDLRGADLSETDLGTTNLQGSAYSAETIWPQGFDPSAPRHGLLHAETQMPAIRAAQASGSPLQLAKTLTQAMREIRESQAQDDAEVESDE